MKKTYNLLFYVSLIGIILSWGLFIYTITHAISIGNFWSITPIISHNVPHGIAGWSLILGFIFTLLTILFYFLQ